MLYIYIYLYIINIINIFALYNETVKLVRAFSRTAFPKNSGYFRKFDILENWFGLPLEDVTASYFLRTACPNLSGLPGICAEDIVVSFLYGPIFRNILNILGNAVVEISGIFRKNGLECDYRNIRDISEKWSGL